VLPLSLTNDEEELKTAQYHAPDWAADWTGQRADSKDPFLAGDEYMAWLKRSVPAS